MYIHYSTGNNLGPRTLVCIVEVSVIGGVHFRRFHCSSVFQGNGRNFLPDSVIGPHMQNFQVATYFNDVLSLAYIESSEVQNKETFLMCLNEYESSTSRCSTMYVVYFLLSQIQSVTI